MRWLKLFCLCAMREKRSFFFVCSRLAPAAIELRAQRGKKRAPRANELWQLKWSWKCSRFSTASWWLRSSSVMWLIDFSLRRKDTAAERVREVPRPRPSRCCDACALKKITVARWCFLLRVVVQSQAVNASIRSWWMLMNFFLLLFFSAWEKKRDITTELERFVLALNGLRKRQIDIVTKKKLGTHVKSVGRWDPLDLAADSERVYRARTQTCAHFWSFSYRIFFNWCVLQTRFWPLLGCWAAK